MTGVLERKYSRLEEVRVEQAVSQFVTGTAYLLLHLVHTVLIGYVRQGKIYLPAGAEFCPLDLLFLRAFSPDAELYIWRVGEALYARTCRDIPVGRGREETGIRPDFIYEERHLLWGRTVVPDEDGWSGLEDTHRGFRLVVPFTRQQILDASRAVPGLKKREAALFYKVRNYYAADEDGMLNLIEARLCGFCDYNGNMLEVLV